DDAHAISEQLAGRRNKSESPACRSAIRGGPKGLATIQSQPSAQLSEQTLLAIGDLPFRELQGPRHFGKWAALDPTQDQQAVIHGRYFLLQLREEKVHQFAIPTDFPLPRGVWRAIDSLVHLHAA